MNSITKDERPVLDLRDSKINKEEINKIVK